MRLVVKRRELTEPGQLQTLVLDHVDGIEPGLAVLDSRLLLGQATIDVIGLDAQGALVLITIGSVADEDMLLRAVEAYSWCLEYPEAVHRLYPSAQISAAQPPRVMFVVERMPDAFHRKVKQLGFHEVDCIEFRYLDIDGAPAVYFESLARLRRSPDAMTAGAATAPPAPAAERPTPSSAPVTGGRPTSVKLQKLLGADRPAAAREPAQVVTLRHRATLRAEPPTPVVSAPVPRLELARVSPVPDEAPSPVPEPSEPFVAATDVAEATGVAEADAHAAVDTPAPVDEPTATPEVLTTADAPWPPCDGDAPDTRAPGDSEEPALETPPLSLATLTSEPDPAPAPMAMAETQPLELETSVAATPAAEAIVRAAVEESRAPDPVESATPPIGPSGAVGEPTVPGSSVFARRSPEPGAPPEEPKLSFANVAKELLAFAPPAADKPQTAAEDKASATASAFAKPAGLKRPRTIAPPPSDPQPIAGAPKLGAVATRPAPAPKPEAAAAPLAEPASAPAPPAFEGLQFPNDGVLTRQWMEFLNQMAAGK